MKISSIKADNFRNFSRLFLEFDPNLNLFYGDNGSGKTSLLELLYFLSYGKSFRTHLPKYLIKDEQDKFTLFSKIISEHQSELSIGIEKNYKGDGEFKLAGAKAPLSEITELLPIQILNNDSFSLLTDGPTARRQFLDWGLFHVKQSFLPIWRDYQRALKQRNIAIRSQVSLQEIQSWNNILSDAAEKLTEFRRHYVQMFTEIFLPILNPIFAFDELAIKFYQGWPANSNLNELLRQNSQKDLDLGYTYYGAHRADLKLTIKGKPIDDVMSRGQQKIFVWLMRLSQAIILNQVIQKKPIILIDDFGAELDNTRLFALNDLIQQIEGQFFVTAIDKTSLEILRTEKQQHKMFHVKQDEVVLLDR